MQYPARDPRSPLSMVVSFLFAASLGAACGPAVPPGSSPASAPPGASAARIDPNSVPVGARDPPAAPRSEEPPARAREGVARVTAVEGFEKIRQKPHWDAPLVGLFRAGQSVRIKEGPLVGPGIASCAGGWYAVEPRGFVCVGPSSTLASDDPRALAAASVLPKAEHEPFRYGVSVGAPRYVRIPTRAEQRRTEDKLDEHLANLPQPDALAGGAVDGRPSGLAPSPELQRLFTLAERPLVDKKDAFRGAKLAWSTEFDAEGRTWLVTPDLTLVPKDKVRVSDHTALRGLDLRATGERLPVAFLWLGAAPKFARDASGNVGETGEAWPRQAFVPLTDQVVRGPRGALYYEARSGELLRSDAVTVIRRGQPPSGVGPRDKWVSVRVTHGYLVAYEGDTPVFATAVSPGADGINPRPHATRRGRYTVAWKLLSHDMTGVDHGEGWIVDEVPYVAYYKDSYALHGAFWHDDFGRPKSHGCVNLAPADAHALFAWLDPVLPEGWYGVASYGPTVKGTVVEVRP